MALPWSKGRVRRGISGVYLNITVGGEVFQTPNNSVVSFTLSRGANEVSSFRLTLFDITGYDLEYAIATSDKQIAFSYGTSVESMSPVWYGQIIRHSAVFEKAALAIQIEGVGYIERTVGETKRRTFGSHNPAVVFRQIALENGWVIGTVVDCMDMDDPIVQDGLSDLDFIISRLCQMARRKIDGRSGFIYYVEGYDQASSFQDGKVVPIVSFIVDEDVPVDEVNTYMLDYNSTASSTLLRFVPDINGAVVIFGGSTEEIYGVRMDGTRSGKPSKIIDRSTYDNMVGTVNLDRFQQYGSYRAFDDMRFKKPLWTNIIDDTTLSISAFHWTKAFTSVMSAKAVILGDHNIRINQVISINVVLNNGFTHYTSGLYRVLSIVDKIENGRYTTELGLIRSGMRLGPTLADSLVVNVESASDSVTRERVISEKTMT